MRKTIALALVILMAFLGMAQAQENAGMVASNPPSNNSLKPIDIQTFWSGDNAVANGYYYDGLPLQNSSDFKEVIDPLNDPQASGFLRSASDKDAWGSGLFWGGLGVEMAGWADFAVEMAGMAQTSTDAYGNTVTTMHDPNLLPSIALILAGNAGWVGGMLLQGDAGSDRYNAVNRYNYVVQHGDSLSMAPYTSPDAAGLDLTQSF